MRGKVKHGHAREKNGKSAATPEYRAWHSMKARCANPRNPRYSAYGGRGITVCERWESFENFFADVGPRPTPRHSIDRIDPNDGYHPGNVRWATLAQQNNNKRTSRERIRSILSEYPDSEFISALRSSLGIA